MIGGRCSRSLALAVVLSLSLLGAGPPARPSGAGPQQVEAALQEYARLQLAKDAAGLAGFYTPDGELLEPGMDAIRGPEAIRKFLESFADVRIESSSMASGHVDVWGDDAVQWGTYDQRAAAAGKPAEEFRGRFVAQWSRQRSGRWLIRRLMTQPS